MAVDPKLLAKFIAEEGLSHRPGGVSYIFSCPRCTKKKLYVRRSDGRFICWVCAESQGYKGWADFCLAELTGLPLREVRTRLGFGGAVDESLSHWVPEFKDMWADGDDDLIDVKELPPEVCHPPDHYNLDHKFAKRGVEYLLKRGVPMDVAVAHGLKYCPTQQRLIFPIIFEGKLRGWQGRHVGDTEMYLEDEGRTVTIPKILTAPRGLRKEQLLMFGDNLKGLRHAVLCEGPVDALKAALCLGNVATMGKVVSMAQLQILRDAGIQKLYLALDPDAATETRKLAEKMGDLDVFLMQPPQPYKDLGEMPCNEVLDLFLRADRFFGDRVVTYFKAHQFW